MNIQKLQEEPVKVSDPRRAYGNLRHELEDIITIGLLSTIGLGEDFADMEEFGKERKDVLLKIIFDLDTFALGVSRVVLTLSLLFYKVLFNIQNREGS
jgi:hypothetical protein